MNKIKLGLGLVGAAMLAPVGLAVGQDAEALKDPCADRDPCVIINGFASPKATGDERSLTSAAHTLAAAPGRSASECPEAAAAYAAAGTPADAVIGPCPPPASWPDAMQAEVLATHARAANDALEAGR